MCVHTRTHAHTDTHTSTAISLSRSVCVVARTCSRGTRHLICGSISRGYTGSAAAAVQLRRPSAAAQLCRRAMRIPSGTCSRGCRGECGRSGAQAQGRGVAGCARGWGAKARYLQGFGRARPSKARAPARRRDVSVGLRLVRVALLRAGSPGLAGSWLPRVVVACRGAGVVRASTRVRGAQAEASNHPAFRLVRV